MNMNIIGVLTVQGQSMIVFVIYSWEGSCRCALLLSKVLFYMGTTFFHRKNIKKNVLRRRMSRQPPWPQNQPWFQRNVCNHDTRRRPQEVMDTKRQLSQMTCGADSHQLRREKTPRNTNWKPWYYCTTNSIADSKTSYYTEKRFLLTVWMYARSVPSSILS